MKKTNARFQVSFDYTVFTVPTPELNALCREADEINPHAPDEPYKDSPGYEEEGEKPMDKTDPSKGKPGSFYKPGMSVDDVMEEMTGYRRPAKKTPRKPIAGSATPKLIEAFKALCKKERRTTANALEWLMTLAVESGKLDLIKRPPGDPYKWQ